MLHAACNTLHGSNLPSHVAPFYLLRMTRNTFVRGNILLRDGLRELQRRLPPGWSVAESPPDAAASASGGAVEITSPDRRKGVVAFETRPRLDPGGVRALLDATLDARALGPLVVVSRYLSEGTRARLQYAEVGYLDLTGNVRLVLSRPGLFLEAQGASEDPDREERPARTLRGPKAGRVVRALIDRASPPGVRALAALTQVDAGYASRVLALLDREALVTRVGHGRLQSVDWQALLRRWAREAPLGSRGRAQAYAAPNGTSALVASLARSDERYALSGELASTILQSSTPADAATVWVQDAAAAAARLGLHPAEAGAKVVFVEPGDDGVFEGATRRDGAWYAAPSQVAADLLTSPGDGPARGEALMGWMLANEPLWRR